MIITQNDTSTVGATPPESTILAFIPQSGQETAQWLLDQYHAANAENCQLREELAQEREEHAQTRQRLDDLEHRHTEQHGHYADAFKWLQKLLANATIPPACKLVLLHIYLTFYFVRYHITNQELRIGVEDTAAAIGASASTVRRAADKYQTHDVLKRRYEPLTTKKGDRRTLVYFTLNDIVLHPESIVMENEHGGARVKGCKNTQCPTLDPMDTEEHREPDGYRAEYCDTCDTVMLDTLPGLRADADPQLAIKAIQEGRVQLTNRLYKMTKKVIDAIIPQSDQDTPTNVTQLTAREQPPELVKEISRQDNKKQDAFIPRRSPEEEIPIDEETERLGQRFAAAVEILAELNTYGYTLDYLQDGQRQLTRTGAGAKAPAGAAERLRAQIEQYNPELMQIWQDSQEPPTVQTNDSDQNGSTQTGPEIAQHEASDQDGSAGKQDAFSPPAQEPRCGICQEHEATGTMYEHGEPTLHYCKACEAQATRPASRVQDATEQYPPLVQQVGARPPAGYQCQAVTPLRADGQPARACNEHGHADKWTGKQQCKGTSFSYDQGEHAYYCRACLTPYRPPTI